MKIDQFWKETDEIDFPNCYQKNNYALVHKIGNMVDFKDEKSKDLEDVLDFKDGASEVYIDLPLQSNRKITLIVEDTNGSPKHYELPLEKDTIRDTSRTAEKIPSRISLRENN